MIEVFIGSDPITVFVANPLVILAAVGLGLSAAQMGASIAGGIFGKKKADKVNRLRKKLLEKTHAEDMLQMETQFESVLGMQRARYGALGVEVDRGSPRVVREETTEARSRACRNLSWSYVYERKGGGGRGPSVGTYFSGLSDLAQASGALYSSLGNRPTPGTTSPSSGTASLRATRNTG